MRKALIAVIVASALFAVGAFAANFITESEDIASGSNAVAACTEKVNVDFSAPSPNTTTGVYEVATATVQFLNESNQLTDECEGYNLQLAIVYNGAAVNHGPVVIPQDATSHTFTLAANTQVSLITSASVAVDGKTLTTVVGT